MEKTTHPNLKHGFDGDGNLFGHPKKTKSGRKVVRVRLANGLWITKTLSPYAPPHG